MDKKLEKIIDLKLDASDRDAERHGLIQYNYGQILRIHGLDLPPAVEIQFSYREKGGTTENRIGTTKDGITEVQIPDKMLKNNGTTQDYAIWVFVYVTDETSGNTVYRIKLYVDSRPAPGESAEDPDEPHPFDEAVNAVNAAAERAETAEAEARSAADSAATSAESARKSAEEVTQEKNTAILAIQNQQTVAEKAITDHTDTEIARQIAATKEVTDVLTGQINKAGTAESELKTTVEDAGKKKTELEEAIGDADTAVENVKKHANSVVEEFDGHVTKKTQEATTAIETAMEEQKTAGLNELDSGRKEALSTIGQAKTEAVSAVEQAKTEATTAVSDASTEAVSAVNTATEAGVSAVNEAVEDGKKQFGGVTFSVSDSGSLVVCYDDGKEE